MKTWAEELGNDYAARLLGATLEEEKNTDAALTKIAEANVNHLRRSRLIISVQPSQLFENIQLCRACRRFLPLIVVETVRKLWAIRSNLKVAENRSVKSEERHNAAEEGNTANIKQNTTNKGFFRGRRIG